MRAPPVTAISSQPCATGADYGCLSGSLAWLSSPCLGVGVYVRRRLKSARGVGWAQSGGGVAEGHDATPKGRAVLRAP